MIGHAQKTENRTETIRKKKSVNKKEQEHVANGTVDNNMKTAIRRILSGSAK